MGYPSVYIYDISLSFKYLQRAYWKIITSSQIQEIFCTSLNFFEISSIIFSDSNTSEICLDTSSNSVIL